MLSRGEDVEVDALVKRGWTISATGSMGNPLAGPAHVSRRRRRSCHPSWLSLSSPGCPSGQGWSGRDLGCGRGALARAAPRPRPQQRAPWPLPPGSELPECWRKSATVWRSSVSSALRAGRVTTAADTPHLLDLGIERSRGRLGRSRQPADRRRPAREAEGAQVAASRADRLLQGPDSAVEGLKGSDPPGDVGTVEDEVSRDDVDGGFAVPHGERRQPRRTRRRGARPRPRRAGGGAAPSGRKQPKPGRGGAHRRAGQNGGREAPRSTTRRRWGRSPCPERPRHVLGHS